MNRPASSSPTFDVAIIGRGPVGATLANLLGLCGLRTVVLEREASAYHLPRALHFDDEVMRVFQATGLSEKILPHVILSPGMHFVDAQGRLVLDWSRSTELTPMGWHLSYRFHQPDLEDILNTGLERWPNVRMYNRCDVYALDQDDSGVRVRYEDTSSGQLAEIRAGYVVGCDGARSLVRRFMGSGMEDLGFHERWLVVDLQLTRERPDLGDHSVQHCDPQRPATYVRGTGNRRRWEIALHADEDTLAATQPARVWQLLARWITPADAEIERTAVYTFHSAIATTWRDGRLLLAGDSAHQTPPFLGQGLCAGIRDAANLAWKLQHVVRGRTDPGLLDTYQSERAPHVREFIELAVRLGGLINTKAMEAGLATGVSRKDAPAKLEVRKPQLGPGLSAGRVMSGHLAPQFTLLDGERSDDHVGYGFTLLADAAFADDLSPDTRATLASAGVEILSSDEAPRLGAWLRENAIRAALVRPDRYILGAVQNDTDVRQLLAALTCAPHVPTAA